MSQRTIINERVKDVLLNLDISEPNTYRFEPEWKRVPLDLAEDDRRMIADMKNDLGLSTTRETIRRALIYTNSMLRGAKVND